MGTVSAAESSATGTSIGPDAVARLPGCHHPGLARGRLQARAGGSAGGAKRSPPALVDRSSNDTARPQPPLHPVGPSLPLGETFLGLRQPVHHQQLAQQVIQGLAGGPPVGIAECPCKERVGLLSLLRGHPPWVFHPLAPWIDASGAAVGSWLMTSTISTNPKAARSRRRAASWSSSTSGTQPSCRHHGRSIGPLPWPAPLAPLRNTGLGWQRRSGRVGSSWRER